MSAGMDEGLAGSLTIDGLKLHTRSYGGAAGTPALMCLHGGMAHTAFFDPLATCLALVARPFSMDRRGHGNSDWTEKENYGFRRDVEDLEEVCAQLDAGPWILVGHSQGGVLTVPALLRDNFPIAGAVLLDIPYDPMAPEMLETGDRLRRIPQIRYPSEAIAKRGFQPYPLPHRASDDVVKHLADRSFRPSGDGGFFSKFHWTRMRALREPDAGLLDDFTEQFRRISCPVLAVRGGDSTILSAEDHAEMVRRLPQGRGVTLPEATHSLHLEQPEALAAVIAEFLTEFPELSPSA
jgi:pimeloyl-ACP methyl ester carboxylesterase